MTRISLAIVAMVFAAGVATAKEGVNSDEVLEAPEVKKGRFFKKAVEEVQISGKRTGLAGRKTFLVPQFKVTFLTDSS